MAKSNIVKTDSIVLAGTSVGYVLKVSARAQSIRLTLNARSGLIVSIPRWVPYSTAETFVRRKSSWILRNMKRISGKIPLAVSNDEYHEKRHQARAIISERLAFFNSFYGFSYTAIRIGNQSSVWGSCSARGTLSFNYKLVKLSSRYMDYVIVHEVCHLKEHNHSVKFWALVRRMIPDYLKIRKEMRAYVLE